MTAKSETLWDLKALLPSQQPLANLDRAVRGAALGISRRRFINGAFGVVASAGLLTMLQPLPVAADNCRDCFGPCGNYQSCTGTCCSPSGAYCWQFCCTCNYGACQCTTCDGRGNCGHYFSVDGRACDSGAHYTWCTQTCWGLTC